MSELFGKDKIPLIGRRQLLKLKTTINDNYPELIEIGKQFIQEIINNLDSVIRAYVNCYYWIYNPLFDIKARNLGYINELQTNITYLFKANIIDYIQNILQINNKDIIKYINKYFGNNTNLIESTLNTFRKSSFNTDGKIELFILSHIISLPIIVYDNYLNIKYLFLQGEIEINKHTIKNFTNESKLNKTIILKFEYDNSNIPKKIYSIYYL